MRQPKKAQIIDILSDRLRISRKRLGLTQEALAKLTGFSLSAIGNWESCQNGPSPAKLGVLSKKLGVTIDYLLGNEEAPARLRHPAIRGTDENSFAVTIEGDSMEPKFTSGDIAILMPNVEPRNGCLVVCKLKNEGVFFKLFHQSSDGKMFRLSSYNPVYPVMECHKEDFVWIYPVCQVTKNVWR